MEKGKGTTLFRILVIVLLAANLAVNTLVYVRLGRSGHDISKETGTVSEETVKAAQRGKGRCPGDSGSTGESLGHAGI